MKRFLSLIPLLFFLSGAVYSQSGSIQEFDDAVRSLAGEIHVKLTEKRAERAVIGQFTFQDTMTPFSSYWVNQLIGEITNTSGRNYSVHAGSAADAGWMITGEIVQAADIIRVYSRLIRMSDRAIEGTFYSSFERTDQINEMLSGGGGGGSGSGSGARDAWETDSWDNPVSFTIGTSANTPFMNRSVAGEDEDFFLLVPDRDGRLTAETSGNIDTYMHFFDYDSGEELAVNDDGGQGLNARININVRAGTRYLALVRGYGSNTAGAYGFRAYIIEREGSSGMDNPIAYAIGATENDVTAVNRTLQEGDQDYFLLVPSRDGRLTIETTGRIDTYMELFDADSRDLLDENDDGGQNYNARLRYNVRAGNRYIVMVRGYSSTVRGSYGFRAFFPGAGALPADAFEPDDEPSQAGTIEIGQSQERTFHSGDDVDWIRFQVPRAGRYTINVRGMTNNRLDTYIELYSNNMNLVAEDDDGGDVLSSRITMNLNSGTYYLKIWCLDEEPDQGYTVSITAQ